MRKSQKQKIQKVHDILLSVHGPQKCFLVHRTPFELLVATILSAQCTDKTVNLVTPELFRRWGTPEKLADAVPEELEQVIHSCGFYHAKGKNLRAMAEKLVTDFHGEVPQTMEELTSLPGVGRKTANVVLGDAMGIPGLPVDTHVLRLSSRIGMSSSGDPVKVEADLCAALAPGLWSSFSHLVIVHGRTRCSARKPDCLNCELKHICNTGEKK